MFSLFPLLLVGATHAGVPERAVFGPPALDEEILDVLDAGPDAEVQYAASTDRITVFVKRSGSSAARAAFPADARHVTVSGEEISSFSIEISGAVLLYAPTNTNSATSGEEDPNGGVIIIGRSRPGAQADDDDDDDDDIIVILNPDGPFAETTGDDDDDDDGGGVILIRPDGPLVSPLDVTASCEMSALDRMVCALGKR